MNTNKIITRRGFEEKGEEKKEYEHVNNIYRYSYISKVDTSNIPIWFEDNLARLEFKSEFKMEFGNKRKRKENRKWKEK
jgi:hypothetical protein